MMSSECLRKMLLSCILGNVGLEFLELDQCQLISRAAQIAERGLVYVV